MALEELSVPNLSLLMLLKLKNLRFGVGDSVACNTGGSFQKGKVTSLMYREEGMPPGMVAPYQVKLDSGSLIYVPEDTEGFVRKA